MKFLLTNDDGFDAPGLAALAEAASALGEVVVIAPEEHHSGCSHRATTHRPLALRTLAANRHALDGSPVDCVRIALAQAAADADWVLAGINDGGNLGADVYMSGTVAAAREACLWGKPAIAISQFRSGDVDWRRSAEAARSVLGALLTRPAVLGKFWNVNIPHGGASDTLPEWIECPLDPHPLPIRYLERSGQWHYQLDYQQRPRQARHDVDVCFGGWIAVTQLSLSAAPPTDRG